MDKITPYVRVWAGKNKVKAIIALTHPIAVIIFSLATLILACFTAPCQTNLTVIILLTLAMAAAQASNGIFNEVFDYELDRINKPWRAIPAGYIQPRIAAALATATFLLSLLFALVISPKVMFLLALGTGVGILYSFKLKRTRFSWLPYVIAYPSLPVWVLVALGLFEPSILWVYLLAAPFAIGIHLTNQMRDYDEDLAAGVRGFAQHLGKQRAAWLTFLLLAFGPLPSVIMSVLSGQWLAILPITGICILHWALILPLHWFPVDKLQPENFRLLFRRLQISCLGLLLTWYWVFLAAKA